MNESRIFTVVGSMMYPFLLIFGFYIVIHGDLSPGGGFQGGVLFSTAFFIRYLLDKKDPFDIKLLARFEKLLYIVILMYISFSLITKGELFTNFIVEKGSYSHRVFLVGLNFLIGLKVTSGVILVISAYIEEGDEE
jgi:multicomponent Na+:H+ antiporter subunit B